MTSSLVYNIITLVTISVLAATAIIYFYYQKKFKYWGERNVPHKKPYFPLGNFFGLKDYPLGILLRKIYHEGKQHPYYGFWLLYAPAIMINDPKLIKRILLSDFMNFHDRGAHVDEKNDPLAANLFNSKGAVWRNLRVKLTPTFTSVKMKMMFPIMVEKGKELQDALLEHAKVGNIIDAKEYVGKFLTDTVSSAAFGIEANSLRDSDAMIRKMGRKVFEPTWNVTIRNLISLVPDLARLTKLTINVRDVSKFFLRTFREIVDFRQRSNIKNNDAMQLFIEILNKGYLDGVDNPNKGEGPHKKIPFKMKRLAAEAFMFFVAGSEFPSVIMQFALYELAKNPHVQTKLRNEIRQVLAKHNGETTYEAIHEMEYLGRVIDEASRIYPQPPSLNRMCTQDFKDPDSDLVIEKGTLVVIAVPGIHMDERYYPDPEKFDPDRFTEEQKALRPNYTHLPFGDGPRACIGQRFSRMQMKVMLIALFSKFKLDISDKYSPKKIEFAQNSILLNPKGGMFLKISLVDD